MQPLTVQDAKVRPRHNRYSRGSVVLFASIALIACGFLILPLLSPEPSYRGQGVAFRYPRGWEVTPMSPYIVGPHPTLVVQNGNAISRWIVQNFSPTHGLENSLTTIELTYEKGFTRGVNLNIDETEQKVIKMPRAPNTLISMHRIQHSLGPALDVVAKDVGVTAGSGAFVRHSLYIFPTNLQQDQPFMIRTHIEVAYATSNHFEPLMERTLRTIVANLTEAKPNWYAPEKLVQ